MEARKAFFLFSAFLVSLAFSCMCYLRGGSIAAPGPAVPTVEVTKSLWLSGTLRPELFDRVYQAAQELSRSTQSEVWQDVFALDTRGQLAPKHSLISSVIAVPFYALFGNLGFWVLQQLLFIWLLYSTYSITIRITGRGVPLLTVAVACILSPVIFYSYGFATDLHGCAFLIGGFSAMQRRPAMGAFLMSLSVFVRPSNVLLVCPLLFALYDDAPRTMRVAVSRCLGVGIGFGLFLWMNHEMWGSSFTTVYGRLPGFRSGELFISPHPMGFDRATFVSDWPSKLWGEKGIFPFTLCAALLPAVVLSLWKQSEKVFQSICLGTAVFYALYIFSYPMWMASNHGNRFLLAATFLYIPSCVSFIARRIYGPSTVCAISLRDDRHCQPSASNKR